MTTYETAPTGTGGEGGIRKEVPSSDHGVCPSDKARYVLDTSEYQGSETSLAQIPSDWWDYYPTIRLEPGDEGYEQGLPAGYRPESPPSGYPAGPSANQEDPPGMSVGAATPATVREVTEGIWARRPILRAIWAIARQRRVGPWAVLGGVLAHACCRIGPHVVLPPIVSSKASLNLFVGLVGPSGGGKDAAAAVAEEFLRTSQTPKWKVGTGQGIAAMFTRQHPKLGSLQQCDTVLFTALEIDTILAHKSMNGSTLMSTLREVYSGSELGEAYADHNKRRRTRAHHYRACLIAGIQPARSEALLGEAAGGTPQRWLWLPANAEPPTGQMVVPPADPAWWTDYEVWQPHGEVEGDESVVRKPEIEIPVCRWAKLEIIANREGRLYADLEEEGDLQGHALLTRLKVAALLGFLDKRCGVTDDDWELAGLIMTKSEETRAVCQNALNRQTAKRQQAQGRANAIRQHAAEELLHDDKVSRACRRIRAKLENVGEIKHKDLRDQMDKLRPAFDDAVALLIQTGFLVVEKRLNAQKRPVVWYKAVGAGRTK